jgi:signal transduction histidine kinase
MRTLKLIAYAILFWTALSLFFALQIYLLTDRISWHDAFGQAAPRWYVWGLLTPAISWLDRQMGAQTAIKTRVAFHIPLGIAMTLLAITTRLFTRPLRGSPWPSNIFAFYAGRFNWDLLIYAVIAGVCISREYARQVKQRDEEAHRMELRATNLERRLVEAQLQSLRAQLHPHFLFNALNTISAFTETAPQRARRMMERLAQLLRASLRYTSESMVTLGQELAFLEDYLAIESARFEGRITVSVQAADNLLALRVPGFLLQPLVENAIRHGVAKRVAGGHVEVSAWHEGQTLWIRVRDNGAGLPDQWQFPRDAGIGLRNIASRLEHLYGRTNLLQIGPAIPEGVEANVEVPLEHQS